MFDMYNKITEQMFGTVVRGGFTNEKRDSTAEKIQKRSYQKNKTDY